MGQTKTFPTDEHHPPKATFYQYQTNFRLKGEKLRARSNNSLKKEMYS
jgi:hypothetical protein